MHPFIATIELASNNNKYGFVKITKQLKFVLKVKNTFILFYYLVFLRYIMQQNIKI